MRLLSRVLVGFVGVSHFVEGANYLSILVLRLIGLYEGEGRVVGSLWLVKLVGSLIYGGLC
jgi:hypothetical protein